MRVHDLRMAWASRSIPASSPSTSMISTAPASTGKPKPKACSTARIIRLSSISRAAGTIPAAMIPLTVSVAWSTVSNTASSVRPASGSRVKLTTDFGDDAESALVADDQPGQVVAGVVFGHAAGFNK